MDHAAKELDRFEARQLARLQPLLRMSLFIFAGLFVAFAGWEVVLGSRALLWVTGPLRVGFSLVILAFAAFAGPGSSPGRTVGILYAAVATCGVGVTLLAGLLPAGHAFGIGSLALMALVLAAVVTVRRTALVASGLLVGTANVGFLAAGFSLESVLATNFFLVPAMGIACLLAAVRETGERDAFLLEQALLAERATLQRLASTDSLTGAANRRSFLEAADAMLELARQEHRSLSVLVLDVDHFKRINDTMGHAVGDATLRGLTETCVRALRGTDVFGRLGGEEFAAMLPDTGQAAAVVIAERVRRAIAETEVVANSLLVRFTASLGVAELSPGDDSLEEFLGRADRALYVAKRGGRNRVAAA